MRRCAAWLGLLVTGCVNRAIREDPPRADRCPNSYDLERVAEGETVRLDWSDLRDGDPGEVDRVVLGRLPVGAEALRECRDLPDFEWSETLEVEPGTTFLDLSPEDIGGIDTSTVVTLRILDEAVASLALAAGAQAETTLVEVR